MARLFNGWRIEGAGKEVRSAGLYAKLDGDRLIYTREASVPACS